MSGALLTPPALEDDPFDEPTPYVPPTRAQLVGRIAALVAGTVLASLLIDAVGGRAWVLVVWSVIVIIMLHEAGHFVTAKWSGMKATEFFVGFGPRLWSIRRGETEYGVKALPLGGYVRILGMTSMEELDPSDEPRSFVNQSTGKRVLVASAGSIVHLLIAISLAIGALWFIGYPKAQRVEVAHLAAAAAGATTPAMRAGLHAGDIFVTMNGTSVNGDNVVSLIRASADKPMRIVVLRHGRDVTLRATPEVHQGAGYLGINLAGLSLTYRNPGVLGGVTGGFGIVWRVTAGTGAAFWHAFSPDGITSLFHQVTSAKAAAQASASGQQVHSLPGALALAVDAARAGPLPLIEIMIALNISLALLNMLPMLPLDGGHVAIALYERVRTRRGKARYRADVAKLLPVAYAFMGFLLLFVAGRMYLDFAHGVQNPFG